MEQPNERIGSANPSQDPDASQPKSLSAKFTPYVPGYGSGAVVSNQCPQQVNVEGFNITPLPYGPYPAYTIPLSPIMVKGHIYSPTYIPNVRPAFQEASTESGSGYLVPVGSFSPGNLSGNISSSPLPSPIAHPPQPVGILGSYDQSVAQTTLEDAGTGLETQPLIVLEVALARMQGFQPWDYQKQDSSTDSFDIPYNLEAKSINPNSILV
ncbi:hypothetical protein ACFE04_012545 [Oxalis oulophora]